MATPLYIDNNGALMMGNAQQPTRRTKHMDIRKLVLQDWVQRDLIILKRVGTADNYADALTKPMGRQLHYRHNDYILGKCIPQYAQKFCSNIADNGRLSDPKPLGYPNDSLCSPEHGGGKIPKGDGIANHPLS